MRKLIKIPFLIIILAGLISCSSNNAGEDDLSIAEIEEIEKTGEFSEEDFFVDEEVAGEESFDEELADVEGDLDIGDDAELLSDVEFEDFEGEDFDVSSDFETDLSGDTGSAEFDEFDEFVTDEAVAQNEGFEEFEDFGEGDTAVAQNEEPFAEEDIFSEFEETQSADAGSETPADDEMLFEDAFAEEPMSEDVALDQGTENLPVEDASVDDLFAEEPITLEEEPIQDQGDVAVATGEVFETDEPTASQLVGDDFTNQVENQVADTAKKLVPVKKMKAYPFRKSGILLNALYVVRPGDTLSSIKNKIYGPGSAANLAALNPALRPGNLRVGQKVYYNSPNRPMDENKMMFFYEDAGAAPQYRELAAGDNIRNVSEEVLGHPRSWMEIWATNPDIESKWAVNRAQTIKYFPEGTTVAPTLAQNEPEVIEPMPEDTTSVAANMNEEPSFNNDPAMNENPPVEDPFANEASGGGNQAMNNEGAAEGNMGTDPNFDQGFDQGFDDQAANEPNFDQGFNDQAANNDPNFDQGFDNNAGMDNGMGQQEANPDAASQAIPDNFRPQAGAKGPFGLDKEMFDTILMGAGGVLLLLGILMLARMRRKRSETGVQDFDFGGEATQIDEQTKTHIDI